MHIREALESDAKDLLSLHAKRDLATKCLLIEPDERKTILNE